MDSIIHLRRLIEMNLNDPTAAERYWLNWCADRRTPRIKSAALKPSSFNTKSPALAGLFCGRVFSPPSHLRGGGLANNIWWGAGRATLAKSKEYSAFQTRREYLLVGSSKDPSFDGLKYCVFFTSVPLATE